MAVQVILRLPDTGKDIESVQEAILDALYAAGFSRIEPVGVSLTTDDDRPCGCG